MTISSLNELSRERGVRILFACESGSRAWGFASPDSDYDVRFIYAQPLRWHLSLGKRKDTIEAMLPRDLDLSGWELGKALRLFAGGNLSMNEWLGSPIVYLEDERFTEPMRALLAAYFNPRKGLHHYLGIARKTLDQALEGDLIGIKKLFYVLRPLLACQWIIAKGTMPPTAFSDLLEAEGLVPDTQRVRIDAFLAEKATAPERHRVHLDEAFLTWLTTMRDGAEAAVNAVPVADPPGLDPLEDLMMRFVQEASS